MIVDKGFNRIIKDLQEMSKLEAKIGILDPDIAVYAFANEEGDSTHPRRPFLSSTVEDNNYWSNKISEAIDKVFDQKASAKNAFKDVCEYAVDGIGQKIESNMAPRNSPETIKRKGSSKTLIDKGDMRQAVTYQMIKKI